MEKLKKLKKKKMILTWLLAINLAALAWVSFRDSDPRCFAANAASLKDITYDGTYFILGVILSPLIFRE